MNTNNREYFGFFAVSKTCLFLRGILIWGQDK